ncbi:MAG: hypothetical protein IJK72_01150 [Mycoplasma sp.]|nr:hypothetical protein [Mycoplasma sp.]
MTKKDEQLVRQSLTARGIKGEKLEQAIKEIKAQGLSFNDLIDNFIAKADADPHSIAEQNCESGKCTAWELEKE